MSKYKDQLALILLIIGGINWGIYGLLGKNLLGLIIGFYGLERFIYFIMLIAAVYFIFCWGRKTGIIKNHRVYKPKKTTRKKRRK